MYHLRPLAHRLPMFFGDRRGSIAIAFALSMLAVCLSIGAAVDFARWAHARHQTIQAMDAAVLAGGRVLQSATNGASLASLLPEARLVANRYYLENIANRDVVINDTVNFDAVENFRAFAAQGNAYIKTPFLALARVNSLPLLDAAEAQHSRAELIKTGPGGNGDPLEIAMMLDVTGSMAGSKIVDLKAAAADLVNIVINDSPYAVPVRVSLVPFAEGVRLPASLNSLARGASPTAQFNLNYYGSNITYKLTECVTERTGANKYTDVAPAAGNLVKPLYNTTIAIYTAGRCGLTSADEVLALTSDKSLLVSRIEALALSGGTAGHVGTAWAWYTLSPNRSTLWPTGGQASAYGSTTKKIAILMTDGEYNVAYDSHAVQSDMPGASAPVNGDSPTQALAVCAGIKAKGIKVYTVGFALGGNATAIHTLQTCATDNSTYYNATNGTELKQAFRDIAMKITPIYLSH
jgi:Flp pilus assembly protein TadG/Tfp pilus assembly protein PilX